jgi:CBS-domain-containing membrane protein
MHAIDIMGRDVVTVGPDTDVLEAARLMAEHDVSALPVVDEGGRVVGIVSEADLIHREEIGTTKQRPWWLEAVTPAATLAEEFAKSHGRKVSELMSAHVVSCGEDTPLSEIAALLERHRIKRVPVLREGVLVGIVSRANLIQALASVKQPSAAALDADRAIRAEVLKKLEAQSWTDFGSRNIIVTNGIVHIWGLVGSENERTGLVALAETVPAAKGVVDEMIAAY